jgi:hypothetical protein
MEKKEKEEYNFKKNKQYEKELEILMKKQKKENDDLEEKINFNIKQFNSEKANRQNPIVYQFKNKIMKLERNQKNAMKKLEKTLKDDNIKTLKDEEKTLKDDEKKNNEKN